MSAAARRMAWIVGLLALAGGCAKGGGRMDLVATPAAQPPRNFFENFSIGDYGQLYQGPYNNLLIVLRSRQPRSDDPVQITEQILVMRINWRDQPGRTAADPSLTNAYILWLIRTPDREIGYEGAGFVAIQGKREKGVPTGPLTGQLEAAHLRMRRGNPEQDIFGEIQISGDFSAAKNPDDARRLANEVEQILGPYPPGAGPR